MYPTILPSIVSLGERTPLDFVSARNPMALENLPAPSSCSSVCFMSSVLFDCTDNLDCAALASLNKLSLSFFGFFSMISFLLPSRYGNVLSSVELDAVGPLWLSY